MFDKIKESLPFAIFITAFLTFIFIWVGGVYLISRLAYFDYNIINFLAIVLGIVFTGIVALIGRTVLGFIIELED